MFPAELTPKIGKTSMTTSDPFSLIFVNKYTSTVRYISTTTDALSYGYDRNYFKLRIRSVFHPKVETFFKDFDIFMTLPGRTADMGRSPKGALYGSEGMTLPRMYARCRTHAVCLAPNER